MDAIEMFGLLIFGGATSTLTLAAMLRLARRTPGPDDLATRDDGREEVSTRD